MGIWLLQRMPALPRLTTVVLGLIALSAFAWGMHRGGIAKKPWAARLLIVIAGLVIGFAWAAWRAEHRLADALPMQFEGRDVVVVGVIAGLPQPLERGARFVLAVEHAEAPVPRMIQLSWYATRGAGGTALPEPRPGERWQLTVRLKRPHGFANPHGFDYEAWLLERGIRATGYVRADPGNVRLDAAAPGLMNAVHRLRDAVRTRFGATLAGREYGGILIALAVGDQRAIPQEQWRVFRSTGVAHLVSISGLHVTLVAFAAGGLAAGLWRRFPALMLRFPHRKAAALAGFAAAAGYALMAGLGLPTQRALIMLGVGALAMLLGRETQGSRVLALALLGVLLVDPWAVLSAGFWLSFGAVGVILLVLAGRVRRPAGWRAAVRIQLAITLATVPLLLALFNAFPLVSPVANALAIPLVSFLIAPLALIAMVLPFAPILELAHALTAMMMLWLEWLAGSSLALWQRPALPATVVAAGVAGIAWLLLPRGTPASPAAVLACVPMILWSPPRLGEGEFRATVLDVGNGMAVHVQTATRDLLYDTGPTYGSNADAGERALLPYLGALGVTRIDRLVISHSDVDHIGGAASLTAGIQVDRLLANLEPDHTLALATGARLVECQAGDAWTWDGVEFRVLHPAADEAPFRRDNDNSCVLRIAGSGGSLLLTGDIEAAAERRLVERDAAALASDVVLVPHHGSRSSSSAVFVRATQAQHAIHAVGYLNPFRHPHPAVWARWSAAGARNWRTDSQGAIQVDFSVDGFGIDALRMTAPRYWHGR